MAIGELASLGQRGVGRGINNKVVVNVGVIEQTEHQTLLCESHEGGAAALLQDHIRCRAGDAADDVGELRVVRGDTVACQAAEIGVDLLALEEEQVLSVDGSCTVGAAEDEVLLALILDGGVGQHLGEGPGVGARVEEVLGEVLDADLSRGVGLSHNRELVLLGPLGCGGGQVIANCKDNGHAAIVLGLSQTLGNLSSIVLRVIELKLDLLAADTAGIVNLFAGSFPADLEEAHGGGTCAGHVGQHANLNGITVRCVCRGLLGRFCRGGRGCGTLSGA